MGQFDPFLSEETVFGPFGGEKFAFTGTFFQGMHSSIYNSTFWQKKIFDPDPLAGQFDPFFLKK